ncbi:MAG: hypothetical protein RI925_1328 [Pseudomonadota bacterium]|jgi:hypothetical protein
MGMAGQRQRLPSLALRCTIAAQTVFFPLMLLNLKD